MKLRGVGADDVKEVREIVQHLFTNIVKPARSERDSRQAKMHVDNLLFQLVVYLSSTEGDEAIGAVIGRVCSFAQLQTEKGVDKGRKA